MLSRKNCVFPLASGGTLSLSLLRLLKRESDGKREERAAGSGAHTKKPTRFAACLFRETRLCPRTPAVRSRRFCGKLTVRSRMATQRPEKVVRRTVSGSQLLRGRHTPPNRRGLDAVAFSKGRRKYHFTVMLVGGLRSIQGRRVWLAKPGKALGGHPRYLGVS